ncbi:MAG TPA: glycosyltransferase family 4 protein [Longimicrobiales bacterium]|nr:glycosyltransferase family 4 protein [Longimicrobiales bacterium]
MKILLLTLVFSPDGVSTAALMTELATELQRMGHQVTVVTTTPHYNHDAEARGRQPLARAWGGLLYRSEVNGIRVLHARMAQKGSRVLKRVLDYARFHLVGTVAALIEGGKYDVVLAPTPPLTIGPHARLLARARGARFVYNVQEVYPDVALRLGVLRPGRLASALERIETATYRHADAVVVISEWFRRRLLEKGVPRQKLHVIPNFVDTQFVQPGPSANPFARAHGLEDSFVVLYSGNLGLTQDFESVLAAADQLAELADVRFVIVGDGARRTWLERQLASGRRNNVLLLPYQPGSAIPDIYATADLGIIPLKRAVARDTFPSKVYTIMASGRPVLASAEQDTELAWLIEEAGCGKVVEPERPNQLAEAIRSLHATRAGNAALGLRGRDYVVARHGREAVCRQYDTLLRELVTDA